MYWVTLGEGNLFDRVSQSGPSAVEPRRLHRWYYTGTRLHSALGCQPLNEFDRGLASGLPSGAVRMLVLGLHKNQKTGEVS